jgi:hypothetical protein
MAEIFLYTPDAKLNSMHLKAMREAGIIPVKVAELAAVKQLARPVAVPDADLEMLSYAAFATIRDYGQYAHAAFGKKVSELLTARTASAIETRQGGDVKQAPSRSDESAVRKGDAHD